jgi:threonine dehydrogenase-like Zn-dependent dehydrogenase
MTSRAVVQTGRRQLEIREFAVPTDLGPDQALLQVEACGMCGSDVDQYEGYYADIGFTDYPVIPGHEMVGRLIEVGDNLAATADVRAGDRVAVEATVPCRVCEYCRSGQGMLCPRKRFLYGYRPTSVGAALWGGYADYMVIGPGTALHKMSDDLTPQDAVLYNPFAAGFEWGCQLGGIQPGDRVLILGSGMRGLGCVIAAREAGAEQIIVTGLARDTKKLRLAAEFGATATLRADDTDIVEAVTELTAGRMAQRVVDTTPAATQPVLDALGAAAPGATIVWAGMKETQAPPIPVDTVIMKGLHIIGAFGVNSWAYTQAVRVVNEQRYRFDEVHTHTLPLDGVEQGIQLLSGHKPATEVVHVTIVPGLDASQP